MCGIHLILSNKKEHAAKVKQMAESAVHRGPDGLHVKETIVGNKFLGLGHNLLHIVGEKPTVQPLMTTNSALIFNGEIYNYNELAKKYDLEKGSNDSSVLHALLEKKGLGCLGELNGMFSFAFIDFKKQKVCLARDTFGQKPLYFSSQNNELIVSSECRSLLSSGLIHSDIRRTGVLEILHQKHVDLGESIYENISSVLPGEIIEIDHQLKIKREQFSLEKSEEKNSLDHLFSNSLALHTSTINSPALFLSGGLDSALLLHYLKEENGQTPVCYTVNTDSNDLSFAKKLVEFYDVPHQIVEAKTENFSAFIQDLDAPVGDGASFLQYELSKEIKKNHKVALSGNGADELFAGYNRHIAYQKFLKNKPLLLLLKRLQFLSVLYPNQDRKRLLKKFFSSLNSNEEATFRNFYSLQLLPYHQSNNNEKFSLEDALHSDLINYLTQDLLAISDLTGMSAGIEIRSPFLDQHIFNYSNQYSVEQKLSKGTKTLLKDLTKKNVILSSISERKKQGFGIHFHSFFKGRMKELIDINPLRDFLSKEQLDQIKRVINQDNDLLSNEYWTLLILTSWLKKEG